MPTVSVITPVYNGERYLRAAIDSLLAQTYQDWELIVVDDGSTDATPDILKLYADPRIKVIRQTNLGAAAARNSGLDTASGQYVAFLDADDVYLPHALVDFAAYLDGHREIDVVYTDGLMCNEQCRPLMRLSEHRPGIYTGHILEAVVLSASVITVPVCTMTRRSAIEAMSLRFDTHLAPSEDWDFWIQLARSSKFGYLNKITCLYRIHQTNITRRTGRKQRRDDLVRGRLKVMNSKWFQDLSVATQEQFFYNLLIGLLADEIEWQTEILQSDRFRSLANLQRVRLLRLIASDYLLRRSHVEFARHCLQVALTINANDCKSRVLLQLMNVSAVGCTLILRIWKMEHKITTGLRTIGRKHSRPVPSDLAPIND